MIAMRNDRRIAPAARCRECNAVTWVISLALGPRPVRTPEHLDGCSRPQGRLDLQHSMSAKRQRELFGDRLKHHMTDAELEKACRTMKPAG